MTQWQLKLNPSSQLHLSWRVLDAAVGVVDGAKRSRLECEGSARNNVARIIYKGYVLLVGNIEEISAKLQFVFLLKLEALTQAQICSPYSRVSESIAPDHVNTACATRTVNTAAQASGRC